MNETILLFIIIVIHFLIISYFDEFLIARHPLFHCKIKMARIIGFGKYKLSGITYFYTIISYCEQKQLVLAKIFRSKDDEIDKEIKVAVGENHKLAVRNEKNNCYGRSAFNMEGVNLGEGFELKEYIYIYIFLNIAMTIYILIEPKRALRLYLIYIIIAIIHYLLLPQLVIIRNFMWDKK